MTQHTKESLLKLVEAYAATRIELHDRRNASPKSERTLDACLWVDEAKSALVTVLDEVMRDAERLDHLAKSVRCGSANIDGNHSWNFNYGHGWKMGANFREAVDRSMKESK